MTRFVDEYLPAAVPGYPATSSPRWSTDIVRVHSGAEQANQRWAHPLHSYTLPEAVREWETVEALRKHWMAMRGPAHTWPWRDPLDFASVDLLAPNQEPTVSGTDQQIGISDGATVAYQLVKRYTAGAQTYTRNIYLPRTASVLVTVNGFDPALDSPPLPWTVTRYGGVVTFGSAPPLGAIIRAGFLFDVEVRFESDDALDSVLRTFNAGGFGDLSFVEVRPCDD